MQNFEREVVVYDFPLLTSIGEMFLRRPIFVLAIRKLRDQLLGWRRKP